MFAVQQFTGTEGIAGGGMMQVMITVMAGKISIL
jgi:hypothetical protein